MSGKITRAYKRISMAFSQVEAQIQPPSTSLISRRRLLSQPLTSFSDPRIIVLRGSWERLGVHDTFARNLVGGRVPLSLRGSHRLRKVIAQRGFIYTGRDDSAIIPATIIMYADNLFSIY